ncbi:MAG TPA: serine hydrolase domain-containing protein [Pirellulaceae bacterium]|nr:serine hydrolase domain-containing protein [Pirellulaceae bacterium]
MTSPLLQLFPLRLVAVAIVVLALRHSHAAEFDQEKLAQIAKRMQKFVDEPGPQQVAGMVIVVGSSQGIALHEALGQQSLETKQPMPKDALFRIASMTKPITAVAIMMLEQEGRLSVDDPVEKHLPEFKGQMLVEQRDGERVVLKKPSRPITIRDLLTHTSGMPGGYPPGVSEMYFDRKYNLAEAVAMISQRPLDFEPGSKWSYCNTGIDTLGRIIEVCSEQTYEAFLQKRIFLPLSMKDTAFHPSEQQMQRLAELYAVKDDKLAAAGWVLIGDPHGARHPIPAGGLFSTGGDLAKLYQVMLRGGTLGNVRFVSEKGMKEMTSLQTGDLQCGFTPGMGFGFGWAVVKEPQDVHAMMSQGTYGHGGAFGTQAWLDPEKDLFVILLIQRTGMPNSDASELRRELQATAVEAIKN